MQSVNMPSPQPMMRMTPGLAGHAQPMAPPPPSTYRAKKQEQEEARRADVKDKVATLDPRQVSKLHPELLKLAPTATVNVEVWLNVATAETIGMESSSSHRDRDVRRRRLLAFLDRPEPAWKLEHHPELKRGAAAWVSKMRREEEKARSKRKR